MTAAMTPFLPSLILLGTAFLVWLGGKVIPLSRLWAPLGLTGILLALWGTGLQRPDGSPVQKPSVQQRRERPEDSSSAGKEKLPESSSTKQHLSRQKEGMDFFRAFGWLVLWTGGLLNLCFWSHKSSSAEAASMQALLLTGLAAAFLVSAAQHLVVLAAGVVGTGSCAVGLASRTAEYKHAGSMRRLLLVVQGIALFLLLISLLLLQGALGTLQLVEMKSAAVHVLHPAETFTVPWGKCLLLRGGFLLFFAGTAIPLMLMPFHFGTPPVLRDSPAAGTAVLATLPRLVGFAGLFIAGRILLPDRNGWAVAPALVVAGGTMLVGSIRACTRRNFRAALTDLYLAQGGAVLLGLALCWEQQSLSVLPASFRPALSHGEAPFGLLWWSGLLSFGGLYIWLSHISGRHSTKTPREVEYEEQLRGLWRRSPCATLALCLLLLNLVGVPPLPGFWARWTLLFAAFSILQETFPAGLTFHTGFLIGTLLFLLQTLLVAVVVFRWIALMLFELPLSRPASRGFSGAWWAGLCLVLLLAALSICPGWLMTSLYQLLKTTESTSRLPSVSSISV